MTPLFSGDDSSIDVQLLDEDSDRETFPDLEEEENLNNGTLRQLNGETEVRLQVEDCLERRRDRKLYFQSE